MISRSFERVAAEHSVVTSDQEDLARLRAALGTELRLEVI